MMFVMQNPKQSSYNIYHALYLAEKTYFLAYATTHGVMKGSCISNHHLVVMVGKYCPLTLKETNLF